MTAQQKKHERNSWIRTIILASASAFVSYFSTQAAKSINESVTEFNKNQAMYKHTARVVDTIRPMITRMDSSITNLSIAVGGLQGREATTSKMFEDLQIQINFIKLFLKL